MFARIMHQRPCPAPGLAVCHRWLVSLEAMLPALQIAAARTENLDCWKATMSLPTPELLGKLPYSISRLPTDPAAGGMTQASGMFW